MSYEYPPTDKINKSGSHPKIYQTQILENMKREARKYRKPLKTFHWNVPIIVLLENQLIIEEINLREAVMVSF